MIFYKEIRIILLIFIGFFFSSCSSENDVIEPFLNITIKNFETSYNEVKFDWEIENSSNIIIRDLIIIKKTQNQDGLETSNIIANLPTNQTSFIDNDIPYFSNISYFIKMSYYEDKILKENEFKEIVFVESEIETFSRDIIFFETAPFQVMKDPLKDNVFHFIDRLRTAELKSYDFNLKKISNNVSLSDNYNHNVVFKLINDVFYISDDKGNFKLIDKNSYEIKNEFSVEINERLRSFAVDGDRIYYHDDDVLKFYDLVENKSVNVRWGYFPDKYMETLSQNKLLFGGTKVVEISPSNCPDANNCWPNILYSYNYLSGKDIHIDPFIFSWNNGKTKFISSYFGDIINVSDLSKEASLKEITGENYFQAVFDNEGKIYATVQGKKLIHIFNTDYELIDSIETKLYPLFPLITNEGLQCIGSYVSIGYYGYYYGFEFNFNRNKCAIEVF